MLGTFLCPPPQPEAVIWGKREIFLSGHHQSINRHEITHILEAFLALDLAFRLSHCISKLVTTLRSNRLLFQIIDFCGQIILLLYHSTEFIQRQEYD
jgi:hypothetical protein